MSMPRAASRQTSPSVTRVRDAPSASPASRRAVGTSAIWSSVVRTATANMSIASATDPAKPEKCPAGTTRTP